MDKLFLEHPEKEYHVRQIARISKKSPTTVSKTLTSLHKGGLLLKRKERGHVLFRADAASSSFKERKIAYNREKLKESGLLERIDEGYNHPEAVIVFGSYARGEDGERSDVDIAIMTPLKKSVDFPECERKLKRRLHLFTLSREDVERMKEHNKELLNAIVNGNVVSGFWEAFR